MNDPASRYLVAIVGEDTTWLDELGLKMCSGTGES